jgi:hypothetical protein
MIIKFIEKAEGTQHKCRVCQQDAEYDGFAAAQDNKKNRSSRTPLCITHAVIDSVVKV